MKYTYHPMHMHLHSCYDYGGSMEGHIVNAASLGMRYIRFTDHDNRIGYKEFPFTAFDFSRGKLIYEDESGKTCGFELIGEPKIEFASDRMLISSDGGEVGVRLTSKGKRHSDSLLADVTLTVGLARTNALGRVIIDIRLSQHPTRCEDGSFHHESVHMKYALGDACDGEIPLEPSDDGIYKLHLSEDVQRLELGGLDNAFCTAAIMLDGGASCELFRLEIARQCSAQEVLNKQRILADEIGARYGVKPFVSAEISAAGQHKCIYGEEVPIIDYAARGYSVTSEQAIDHIKKYGGIFSYNHPFDHIMRMGIADEEKPARLLAEAERLIRERAFGASLMEIGFPEGRHGFSFEAHLKLWDMISLAGVFITGHGDSDAHYNSAGWFDGNNFAAYIAAPYDALFPIDDAVFIESMKAGRVYSADPVYIKGSVNFECEGLPMGAVIPLSDSGARKLRFTADRIQPGWRIRVICSGEVSNDYIVDGTSADIEFELCAERAVSFARIELYNADGRCVLITNPIYLVRRDIFSGEIPKERLYTEENHK